VESALSATSLGGKKEGSIVSEHFIMDNVFLVVIVLVGSVLMVSLTYIVCSATMRASTQFSDWATHNEFRILEQCRKLHYERAAFWYFIPETWTYFQIEDKSGNRRHGRITFSVFGRERVIWYD
jgi:hypothetical protein